MTGPQYQRGFFLVGVTVALSAIAVGLAVFGRGGGTAPPAAQRLGASAYELGSFSLTERSGRPLGSGDLSDRVWIASFIFTRCPASCPRISSVMKSLQGDLSKTGVRLVSISVDPDHDTPEVLSAYAKRYDADPDRWLFLTGAKQSVFDLILRRFKISVAESSVEDQKKGAEAVAHSDRLALIGEGNHVVGLFDSNDPAALQTLIADAKRLDAVRKPWLKALPAVNASLNGTCGVLIVAAWFLIRSGRRKAHAICMISAVTVASIFLVCYLVRIYNAGSKPFEGPATARFVYFTILLSHTLLAAVGVVPYVSVTLARALRKSFDRHARIAAVTLPIWLYVSVTGVVIYFMLYQMTFPSPVAAG